MPTDNETLFRLIKEAGTLEVVRAFLRSRELPSSAGSWDDLFEERIQPALDEGTLTVQNLRALLVQLEEVGKQHVFLYHRKKSTAALTDADVSRWLNGIGGSKLMNSEPNIEEKPDEPTITHVRREPNGTYIIKVVETREYLEQGSRTRVDNHVNVQFTVEKKRAVNIVEIQSSGIVQVRIHSHRNDTKNYADDQTTIWKLIANLIRREDYDPTPLAKAKETIWDKRHTLKARINLFNHRLRGANRNSITSALGRGESILDDPALEASMQNYLKGGNAQTETYGLVWKEQKSGTPSANVVVLVSGDVNEFAVPKHCNRNDYEHVLAELQRHNK